VCLGPPVGHASREEALRRTGGPLGHPPLHRGGHHELRRNACGQQGGMVVTKRIHMTAKERTTNALATCHSAVASLLTFMFTDSSVLLSVYGMTAQFAEGKDVDVMFRLHNTPRTSRRSWPRFYCSTDTDFMNSDTFSNVVDLVAIEWAVVHSPEALLEEDREHTSERLPKEEVHRRAAERAPWREDKVKKRAKKDADRVSRVRRSCVKKEHRGGGEWHVCACFYFHFFSRVQGWCNCRG